MNALGFAWRSLIRQPARAVLGVLGVAAVGALLFDMLLLSNGLLLSMRDLLDRAGADVRVTSVDTVPGAATRMRDASRLAAAIATLPHVRGAIAVRWVDARVAQRSDAIPVTIQAVSSGALPPWTAIAGQDPQGADEIVINSTLASRLALAAGGSIALVAACLDEREALPPVTFRISGIAEFPMAFTSTHVAGATFAALDRACGGNAPDEAEEILVLSSGDVDATAGAIRAAHPELRTLTNAQMLGRLQQNGFTYFRQISTVLTTVTLAFALLLITVLLTVSVNQRLAEIAALRALGFSRRRVVADVLSESALIVGIGGALSLPLGLALARVLDGILTSMPRIPVGLHFFVFEPAALATHVVLLVITAFVAALYPMHIVSKLPIAATLRAETIG